MIKNIFSLFINSMDIAVHVIDLLEKIILIIVNIPNKVFYFIHENIIINIFNFIIDRISKLKENTLEENVYSIFRPITTFIVVIVTIIISIPFVLILSPIVIILIILYKRRRK